MGFENPFFFCIFVTTYLTSTGMTAEERLGKVKSELENLMNLTYNETLNSKEIGYTLDFDNYYQLLIDYFTLWSKCLDPFNVIDARDLDIWKMKLKNLKK